MSRFRILPVVFLIVIIAAGGMVILLRYSPGEPVEISMPAVKGWQGEIYIDGAVNNPGVFPLKNGDIIDDLIRAAGGVTGNATAEMLHLHIPVDGDTDRTQKININRADVWLLDALPGIGETLAQRIIDYRLENGPYRSASEITSVSGIGDNIYQQIKDLITVTD